MKDITINTHNCSREEHEELVNYLTSNNWDFNQLPIKLDQSKGELSKRQQFDKLAKELGIIDQFWSEDDVKCTAKEMDIELSFLELESVCSLLSRRHDAEVGTNWETIRCWIDYVVGERK